MNTSLLWNIALVIGAMFLFACEDPLTERDLLNQEGFTTKVQDTFAVELLSVMDTASRGDDQVLSIIGQQTSALTGLRDASVYTQVNLPTASLVLGGNTRSLDSVVLHLKLVGQYANADLKMDFEVLELKEGFVNTLDYKSNTTLSTASNPIGVLENVSLDFSNFQVPTVRIPLSSEFGERLLAQNENGAFKDDNAFHDFLKGFHIRARNANTNGFVYVDFSSANNPTRLELHYTKDDTLASQINFVIGENESASHISRFTRDFGSTDWAALFDGQAHDVAVMEGMHSSKIALRFPHLKGMNNIIINKAQLILTALDDHPLQEGFPLPNTISVERSTGEVYTSSLSHQLPEQIDLTGLDGNLTLTEEGTYTYTLNIPVWAQQVVNGEHEDDILFLLISSRNQSAARIVFGSGEHPQFSAKLRLVYTEV